MDWNDLKERANAENTFTVTMGTLRDAHGVAKLGVKVNSDISKRLAQMGIGHVPTQLPNSQHDLVRLFLHGTQVGDLISAVLTPGETNDNKIANYANSDESHSAEILNQIRDLIAD